MNKFQQQVAYRTLNLLVERNALLYSGRKAYWVWWLDDHALIIFDPNMVDVQKLNEKFAHDLSTRLNGRMVLRTNSRGLFFQVDTTVPPAPVDLIEKPMNLAEQPSPLHLPIGNTERGDLWISLMDGTSFLVGGMSRMHKSGLLHAWIQALLHGGKVLVYAWDGKQNAEYGRYVGRKNFTSIAIHSLQTTLKDLQKEAIARMQKFALTKHPDIISYNASVPASDFIMPIALFVDEVAEIEDQEMLKTLVKLYRAAGIFPIFATNDPMKASVIAKSNLTTRIAFPVISYNDSQVILGRSGANKLPKIPGRGLMEYNGRMVEFQSFVVEYPEPSADGYRWISEQMAAHTSTMLDETLEETQPQGIIQLAESIRDQWSPELSLNKVSLLLGKPYAGNSWCKKVRDIVEYLTTTTTNNADSSLNGAVSA
jgi:hypothetical protein